MPRHIVALSARKGKYPFSKGGLRGIKDMGEAFEPRVVAFCCHYCAYSAADLAGSMRMEYSPNVRIVKLLCTGKVDTLHLLKAFEDGADAVFVAG